MSETTEERTRERWRQALNLFEQALPLSARKREQLLQSVSDRDAPLRQTVDDLFAAHRETETSDFLETPVVSYQPVEPGEQALVGQRVGAYQLTRYLAKGGMGWVYLAKRADKAFEREVAIKIISADLASAEGDSVAHRRFRREVKILADLKHPNLVWLYDAGRLNDGRPYIVMEYVAGVNLHDWLKSHGPMPPAQVVEVIRQAAAGLHAAHKAGVIHRDIKPSNIILTETDEGPTIKVLDFGVASRQQHDDSGLSSTQHAIGTYLYMSPEQIQTKKGTRLTPASDVYALGLTAYELLTNRPANDGHSQAEIILKHLQETPAPPSQRAPGNPALAAFDAPIMQAISKAPADRYQTAPEFAAALAAALRPKAETVRPTPQPPAPTPPAPTPQPLPLPIPRPRRKVAAVAATLALLALLGAYVLWPRQLIAPITNSATNAPATQPVPTASSTAQPEPGALEFALDLDSGGLPINQRSYSGCRFALLRPGIAAIPAQINAENALVLFEEMRRQYPNPDVDRRVVVKDRVKPGRYLVAFTCPGYRTIAGERTVTEQDGLARLRLSLAKE